MTEPLAIYWATESSHKILDEYPLDMNEEKQKKKKTIPPSDQRHQDSNFIGHGMSHMKSIVPRAQPLFLLLPLLPPLPTPKEEP